MYDATGVFQTLPWETELQDFSSVHENSMLDHTGQ